MKIRDGFVSNSSSSSFIIMKEKINALQLCQIVDHVTECEKYGMSCGNDEIWSIDTTDYLVRGDTWMDNFDMDQFLRRIGVDSNVIEWS